MILRQVDFASPDFDEIFELRNIVLREPLGLEFSIEQINLESVDFHFGVYDTEDNLLGTLLMKRINNDILKMRQVAVHPNMQGKGVGQFMVRAVEIWSKHNGYCHITLAARDLAIPFYKNLTYKMVGKPFTEVGIPHCTMKKKLN